MLGQVLVISGGNVETDFAQTYLAEHSFDTVLCADSGLEAAHQLRQNVDYIMGDFDSVNEKLLSRYFSMSGKELSDRNPSSPEPQTSAVDPSSPEPQTSAMDSSGPEPQTSAVDSSGPEPQTSAIDSSGSESQTFRPVIIPFPPQKDASDTELVLRFIAERGARHVTILGATGGRLDHFIANVHCLLVTENAGISTELIDAHNRLYLKKQSFTLTKSGQWGKYLSFLPFTERVRAMTIRGMKYETTDLDIVLGRSHTISNEFADEAEHATVSFAEGILLVIESKD